MEIAFTDDSSNDETHSRIESLVDWARGFGVDITADEVWDILDGRMDGGQEPATYSWVPLNKFRKFELRGRCSPWTTEDQLRTAVAELPSPIPVPEWEVRDEL